MAAPDQDGVTRLPRGPHKLSREEVVRSQRERLMRAMAEATAEKGYAQTSVADVLARARVSRETFYQQFDSKQECFIAAYETAADMVLAALEAEGRRDGTPLERFDRTLRMYLDALAGDLALARLFMIEVYAVGDEVLELRTHIQDRFAALMIEQLGPGSTQTQRFACHALVGAIVTLVTARLVERDVDGLRALHAPLVDLVRMALS